MKESAEHKRGYQEGRAGKRCDPNGSEEYRRGWKQGEIALEEAENGYNASADPRDW
jgi:hypothetical protein